MFFCLDMVPESCQKSLQDGSLIVWIASVRLLLFRFGFGIVLVPLLDRLCGVWGGSKMLPKSDTKVPLVVCTSVRMCMRVAKGAFGGSKAVM